MSHSMPRRAALSAFWIALVAVAAPACVREPTMRLRHAEISGFQIAFPPSLGITLTVVVDVTNPNDYDVAVRAVRGQVMLANRYPLPVDFRAPGQGVWLPSGRTTSVRVPVSMPGQLAAALVREWYASPMIPYRFSGRADVTATRTFQLERDDYSVDAYGSISRWHMESALRGGF